MAPSPENDNTPKAPDKTKTAEDELAINTSQTARNSQAENKVSHLMSFFLLFHSWEVVQQSVQ